MALENAGRPERRWVLTAPAFDRLLACFHVERERAGADYVRLRGRLVRFFEGRGSEAPEDDADETLNRVARKVWEGEEVRSVSAFAYAIARFVARETRRRAWIAGEARRLLRHGSVDALGDPADSADDSDREGCWRECLARLSPERRELLEEYYREARTGGREWREMLAARRGLSLNALRIQVFRVKEGLRACADDCRRRKRGEAAKDPK